MSRSGAFARSSASPPLRRLHAGMTVNDPAATPKFRRNRRRECMATYLVRRAPGDKPEHPARLSDTKLAERAAHLVESLLQPNEGGAGGVAIGTVLDLRRRRRHLVDAEAEARAP